MRHVVLCDGPVKVQVEANGRGAILSLTGEESVTFSLTKGNIQAIYEGETIQVSHRGVFCRLTRIDQDIHVYFAFKTVHEHATCSAKEWQKLLGESELSDQSFSGSSAAP